MDFRSCRSVLGSYFSCMFTLISVIFFIAPLRQMSSGSVPGSSGESMFYYLLTGVAAFGGLFYVSVWEWNCCAF